VNQRHKSLSQVRKPRVSRYIRALLFLPVAGALWVSSYNSLEPSLAGIPFFYWYQLLGIALSAVMTGIVYLAEL
jgi:hypothetical protein